MNPLLILVNIENPIDYCKASRFVHEHYISNFRIEHAEVTRPIRWQGYDHVAAFGESVHLGWVWVWICNGKVDLASLRVLLLVVRDIFLGPWGRVMRVSGRDRMPEVVVDWALAERFDDEYSRSLVCPRADPVSCH